MEPADTSVGSPDNAESKVPKAITRANIPVDLEIKIVAWLSQGLTYQAIKEKAREYDGRSLSDTTILSVKKRNAGNILELRQQISRYEMSSALDLKDKANDLLLTKLTKAQKEEKLKEKLHDDYLAGEIDVKEYLDAVKKLGNTTIPELVVVSKEMHQQSKSNVEETPQSPKDVEALAKAIREGDEVTLNQLIWKKKDASSDQPT